MNSLALTIVERDGSRTPVEVRVNEILVVGYTGRNRDRVLAHIRELERLGIAAPPQVPMVYVLSPELLTVANAVDVTAERTSGEVEFCLITSSAGMLVAVGSDHTDRQREVEDVAASKGACPHPISREVWRYEDVRNHWDALQIRSWAVTRDSRLLYQSGTLEEFLPAGELLAELARQGYSDLDQRVVFGGTLPVAGDFIFAERFEAELYDDSLRRTLTCCYDVSMQRQTGAPGA